MLQQSRTEKGEAKGLRAAGARLLGLETRLMYSSVIQGSTASTVMPCMHTSQRVKEYHKNTHGNWQLSLRGDTSKPGLWTHGLDRGLDYGPDV